MRIGITTLSENTASWLGVLAEWGLSMLVEVDDVTILVDTGGNIVAAHNALALGVNLESIDTILFSHGHEDHTGGLLNLLKLRTSPVEVIAHPGVWVPKYWKTPEEESFSYIGIPYCRQKAESLGASFRLSEEPVWITKDIVTSGEVPMVTEYETIETSAFVNIGGEFRPDLLSDDQSVFIRSPKGVIVISGCAHRGIVNTMIHAQHLTGASSVYAVIGGTHLFAASEERIRRTMDEFRSRGC